MQPASVLYAARLNGPYFDRVFEGEVEWLKMFIFGIINRIYLLDCGS